MGLLIAPDDDRRRLSVYRQLSPKFSAFTHVYDFSRWHSFPDLVNLAKQGVDTANVAVTLTPHSRIGGHGATCEDTAYSHLDINGNPFATSTCTYFFVEASSKASAIVLNSKYNASAPSESGGLQIRVTSTGGVQIIKNQTALALEATSGRTSGQVNAIAVSVNGNNGRHAIFSNGRLIAQSTPTVTYTHGTSALFNGAAENALQFLGPIFSFAFAPTVLPDGALIELTGNPDALFNGELGRILYFPSAGGGGATITAATESLTLSTFGATIGSARAISGALESLSLTPYAALVASDRAITAAVESISLGTFGATVANNATIAGGLESIALTANAASITLGAAIAAAMEAIVLAANPAAVRLDAAIAAQLEAITITGLGATISTSSDVNIGAALESITLSVPQALVSSDRTIAGGLESIQITANGATVTLGALIGAALESIALTSYGAGITLNVTLPGGLEQINLTTLAAQIGLGSNVAALVEAITLTPFGATLTMTGEITAALESIGLTTFVASVTGGESALTTPGLEFTVPVGRMHYAIPIGRIHFTIPRD